jgi:tmRNA-binding protein
VEIALARGRKLHDKREVERKKQLDKEAREAMAVVKRR